MCIIIMCNIELINKICLGLFHLNIPGRGERHLFQTPPPIEEEEKIPPTTTRKKNNHKNNFRYRNTQSFALM